MFRNHTALWILAGVLAAGLLAGCGGPKLINAWQDPSFKSLPFDDVLVMGVGNNPSRVRVFEQAFTEHLQAQGIRAQPSYELFTPEEQASKEDIEAAIKSRKIDAIIITRVLGVDRKSTYTPGYTMATPGSMYYRDYYGLYTYSYGFYHSPGYTTTYDVVQLETNIYDVASGKLVWTGLTETVDPNDIEKEATELAKIVLRELTVRGLVAK